MLHKEYNLSRGNGISIPIPIPFPQDFCGNSHRIPQEIPTDSHRILQIFMGFHTDSDSENYGWGKIYK